MGLGPIPFTAIVEYSKIFDVGDFEEFQYFIRAMDGEYLSLEAERMKKTQSSPKGKK